MTNNSNKPLIISNLEALNRKERYYLLSLITGNNAFIPNSKFLKSVQEKLAHPSINYEICQFAAMDYHLDWVYAALYATTEGIDLKDDIKHTGVVLKDSDLVSGTQQDIDFIMAFADTKNDVTHLILIEAKGVGSWDTKQLNAKGARLKALFETHQLHVKANVVPHFLYVSSEAPADSQPNSGLPKLMVDPPHHIQILLPTPLVKLTRRTKNGQPKTGGKFWKFE